MIDSKSFHHCDNGKSESESDSEKFYSSYHADRDSDRRRASLSARPGTIMPVITVVTVTDGAASATECHGDESESYAGKPASGLVTITNHPMIMAAPSHRQAPGPRSRSSHYHDPSCC
jgi:hypothetical protein